jgi:hypothetical protein
MYKSSGLLFIVLICFIQISIGQNEFGYKVSKIITVPKAAVVNPGNITEDWNASLQLLEKANPEMYQSELQKIKSALPAKKTSTFSAKRSTIEQPNKETGFEGNRFNNSVPNDNDLAISNDSKIISVINTTIRFYNPDSSLIKDISLQAFATDLNLPEGKYDPRVIYDPLSDRFIMVFLNGFNDSTSYAIVAFSKTNDPTSDWNVYKLEGNPLHDTSWSDFPIIAINEHELFLTFNLLKNDIDWKTGFKQSIIWQIDLNSGYSGSAIKTRLYSDINYKGLRLRNLCPVQGGSKPINSNIYILSNKNFAISTDSFFFGEITGRMDDTATKFKLQTSFSDIHYGVAPSADQPKKYFSETNDARILDGYYENGTIYFVGNTINFDNNQASVYHGKLSVSNPGTIKLTILKDTNVTLEFGYPSIAYTGSTLSPDESIILFDHTSATVFPGVSCIFYKNGEYSNIFRLKAGNSHIIIQPGRIQRWGDYTGLQRKYNANGIVWGSGYFGKFDTSQTMRRVNATWIASIKSPTYKSIDDKESINNNNLKTFPNPVKQDFTLEFESKNTTVFEFLLYDQSGKQVKLLLKNLVYAGKNVFAFNSELLMPGFYYLVIKSNQEKFTQKLIIAK